ncbi:hypothetical protein ANO14919_038800 [Xylariales sp. No.14919]|nr:hypothetical protein ANO14919_038800 [Xylariales sp. No.14919]
MFGTLRVAPQSKQIDYIERADGKAFAEMGGVVPPHSACTQCRAKKIGCGGQKPRCSRCNAASLNCVYAPKETSSGRRRAKRNYGGEIVQPDTPISARPELGQPHTTTDLCIVVAEDQPVLHSATSTSGLDPSSVSSGCSAPAPSTSSEQNDSISRTRGFGEKNNPTDTSLITRGISLGPVLPTDMLELPFSTPSPEDPFGFIVSGPATCSVNELIGHEYEDLNLFNETISDLGVNLNTLWSAPEVPARPGNHGSAAPLSTDSNDALPSMFIDESTLAPSHLTPGDPENEPKCTRRCVCIITHLLEAIDDRIHNVRPTTLEGVLSWLKAACRQSLDVIQCQTCYADSEQMLLLLLLCDKLIMLDRKLLCHTMNAANFRSSVAMRDYEISEPGEMAIIIRLLCGRQMVTISKLLAGIKASPSVQGKHIQSIMIRNMEQQVAKTLVGVKDTLATSIR